MSISERKNAIADKLAEEYVKAGKFDENHEGDPEDELAYAQELTKRLRAVKD